jgi:putative transposase
VKYACIARHQGEFTVRLMCRVLEVSVSGFYASASRAPSQRAMMDQHLTLHVRASHAKSQRRYGAPRVHEDLKEAGMKCGQKRVARLMRANGLRAKRARRWCVTTTSAHAHPIAPNTLDRAFDISAIGQVNRVWTADITYIPTREGWLYLAMVLDLASRRIVGWATSALLEKRLATSALTMALKHRRMCKTARNSAPQASLVHHSDRGSQYASTEYRLLLSGHGIECSMSRKGNCWDNAVAESFFATLKTELVHGADWHTRDEARAALFEYIEVWYNRVRRHSTLGYKSPVQYELENIKNMQRHVQDVKAA